MTNDAEMIGLLDRMRAQLGEAHALARAVCVVAEEGWIERAFSMALGIEDLVHDANHLLQAASSLNRQQRKQRERAAEN